MKTINSKQKVKRELSRTKDIIDRFINSCSHNLKGPLTSIEGLVMIAKYCTNAEEVNQCLELIQHCTGNMLDTLQKLEEYTVNLHRDLHHDEIEAHQLVERVLEEYSSKINQEQITVSTNVSQAHKWIADEHCNYLILKNLISNAIHFSNEKVKTKKIQVKVGVEADHISMEVSDNGIGILEEEKEKIFEPFHRSSELSRGSGLGLFLVKGLMDKLKASIAVYSNEDIGTSFMLSMPNNLAL